MASEKRLIDAKALKQYLKDNRFEFVRNVDFAKALEMIDCAPTVDAVEVVRCKDCKKGYSDLAPNGGVWCEKWNHVFGDDGFCSYGERKSECE